MMSDAVEVDDLFDCLAGRPRADLDWHELLRLANAHDVGTVLSATLAGHPAVPRDVSDYLSFLADQNALRNLRIIQQVTFLYRVLAEIGVRGVLFKGGALVLASDLFRRHRLLTDIDLLVDPADVETVVRAFETRGFQAIALGQDHAPYDLVSENFIAAIDLHVRLPGPQAFTCTESLNAHAEKLHRYGIDAWIPPVNHSIYINVIHDDFHMGYFFRKLWDLKHIADVFLLQADGVSIDWADVRRLAPNRAAVRAVDALVAATAKDVSSLRPRLRLERAVRDVRMRSPGIGRAVTAVNLAAALFSLEGDLRNTALDTIRSRAPTG